MKRWIALLLIAFISTTLMVGCGEKRLSQTDITLMLDWTPNTNHTGIYVAMDKGYFKEEGLNVKVIQPSDVYPETAVASGKAQFGISFQGSMTKDVVKNGAPLVAIAAILQHDTSGFIWLNSSGITSPKDWEGKTYGGWGSSTEKAMISWIMRQYGADPGKVKYVELGVFDQITGLQKGTYDFTWVYYGWEGIDAKLRGLDFTFWKITDHYPQLDHYTPIFITSRKMIEEHPDVVKAFVRAVWKGYTYASKHPQEAAEILLKHAPELNRDLVMESQKWLSPRYVEGVSCWGIMKKSVWDTYSRWMVDVGLIPTMPDTSKLFTNQFLPCGD